MSTRNCFFCCKDKAGCVVIAPPDLPDIVGDPNANYGFLVCPSCNENLSAEDKARIILDHLRTMKAIKERGITNPQKYIEDRITRNEARKQRRKERKKRRK